MERPPVTAQERLIGAVAHLLVLLFALGLAANIALAVYYRRSVFVLSHLKQAMGLQVLNIIVSSTISLYVTLAGLAYARDHFPHFFRISIHAGTLLLLLASIKLVLVVMGTVRAANGEEYRQPLIGEFLHRLGR